MEEVLTPAPVTTDLLQVARNIGPGLSKFADKERSERRLSGAVMDDLKKAGLFRMYLPQSLGGLETDPVTVARVVEEIAMHNTAAGWLLMVANTTTWWCGRFPEKTLEEIFESGPDTLIASAFHPSKAATRVEGGFLINGRGPLYSYVNESKWVFLTAVVMENGEMKMHEGQPVVIGALLKTSECEIIDTWYTIGMQATTSNDVATKDVFVPDHRMFYLIPEYEPNKHFTGNLYRFPAVGVSVASLLPPASMAIARNAIETLKLLATSKTPLGSYTPIGDKGSVQCKLGKAEALLESGRAFLYQSLNSCWSKVRSGETITMHDRAQLLLASAHANQSSMQAVDLMYTAAGSTSIYTRNNLSHYFADSQVLRQHGFMNESRYETAAQVFLGKQPDLPVILF